MGDGPASSIEENVANVRRHVDYVATVLNHAEASVGLPKGKRLITGASTGEFTLWNGTAFNFETILQAHDSAIRAMTWSHNEQWLVSADHEGFIKYWQPNMNNVHMYQAHKDEPVRGLSFAPTDVKLASASDDGTVRIWDFARCVEERAMRGHGSEVRCVAWHPSKGMIATGSRDSQQPVKLWDPRTGDCLTTLQDHKSSVMAVDWNRNERSHINIMAPCSRGIVCIRRWGWIDCLLAGRNEKEVAFLEHAHDQAVWAMKFHPMGHILATGSNDNNTKFWARNRPGDTQEDIFGLASFTTNMVGALDKEREPKSTAVRLEEEYLAPVIPGMGLDGDVVEKMNRDITSNPTSTHHTMLLMPEDLNARHQHNANIGAKKTLIKQPPPKKAQRQFERMWNVSKPSGPGVEDFDDEPEDEFFQPQQQQRPRQGLLGQAPPPMTMLAQTVKAQSAAAIAAGFAGGFAGAQKLGLLPPGMPPGWKPGSNSVSSSTEEKPKPPNTTVEQGRSSGSQSRPPLLGNSPASVTTSSPSPTPGGQSSGPPRPLPMPPQRPPFPQLPPTIPSGMTPQMLAAAGVWPPGIPMPPSLAQKQSSTGDDMQKDHDYRVGKPSGTSGDVDLRAGPGSLPTSQRGPPAVHHPPDNMMAGPMPDLRRPPVEVNHSSGDQDHRLRDTDDDIRDPRRRPLPQESLPTPPQHSAQVPPPHSMPHPSISHSSQSSNHNQQGPPPPPMATNVNRQWSGPPSGHMSSLPYDDQHDNSYENWRQQSSSGPRHQGNGYYANNRQEYDRGREGGGGPMRGGGGGGPRGRGRGRGRPY
ncbi:hypothetical protein KIN20_027515 [Parelaphostrongylus tenuis]|uniref:Uncharacterized protein n=1 Tax=Parelaphostrongylus tenuis TaxID=148309 RepID=A0AAD5QZH6_PARTN|nr:hypothetical protein KIN20_027515 [Parelaphostrongylus tenuis]